MRSSIVIATALFALILVMVVGTYAYQKYELTAKKK